MKQSSILIVEADVLVRTPLADYLRECGYLVFEAVDGREARELFVDRESEIDILLAEVNGPGESGFSLATWVREHHPATEVILAASATKAVEKAGDLCEDGPDLQKPYDHQLVLNRIKRLLASRERNSQ